MKSFLCAAFFCLSLGGVCAAQQNPADTPASKEDVEKYLQVMNSRDMMTKMADAMSKPIHEMIHQQYLKDKDKLPPDFEARMNKRMDEMFKNFPWDEILDSMVPVYQKHFTKGDMDTFVAFYSTPTGQKMLRELPAITAETMQTMMPLLQKNLESMNRNLEQEITAMVKQGQSKSETTSPQRNN